MSVARKMTRRERDTIDSAYHEAGHAIIALALGWPVSSVTITGERTTIKPESGRTQLDFLTMMTKPWSDHQRHIQRLAGFIADQVHIEATPELGESLTRETFAHVKEVVDKIGAEAMRELLVETRVLVDIHWGSIERLARQLLDALDGMVAAACTT